MIGQSMADETLFDLVHSEIVEYGRARERERERESQGQDLGLAEVIGFSVGYRIMERLTREWPRFKDELDTVKFICTDFWSCIYKKQIDNLRTNHQGIYTMQDNAFRFLAKLSNGHQYLECAPRYVAFTCGLLRGGLANLGINCVVTAEIQSMPTCKFNIEVQHDGEANSSKD